MTGTVTKIIIEKRKRTSEGKNIIFVSKASGNLWGTQDQPTRRWVQKTENSTNTKHTHNGRRERNERCMVIFSSWNRETAERKQIGQTNQQKNKPCGVSGTISPGSVTPGPSGAMACPAKTPTGDTAWTSVVATRPPPDTTKL